MAANASFEVFVSGGSTSVEEYRRAMAAPKSELPELSEQQRFVAKKMRISEEEYKRGVLAESYGESRLVERGKRLGEAIQELLDSVGGQYKVEAVQSEMGKLRWLFRVANGDRQIVVTVPRDLADDVLDSGASEELKKLKNRLVSELNQGEALVKG